MLVGLLIFGSLVLVATWLERRQPQGPVRIICEHCYRDVAPQVFAAHAESHRIEERRL